MPEINGQSVEVSIARMAEQIQAIASGVLRIETTMAAHSVVLGEVPVIKRDVEETNLKIERAFKAIKALSDAQSALSQAMTVSKTYHKVVGSLATMAFAAAMGLSGWCWTQLDGLHKTDSDISLRVNTLEVRSAEADKFTSQGYVRNESHSWNAASNRR